MFVVKVDENKYKFNERYKDKYTDKWRTASVTLDRDTAQSRKKAKALIDEKIKSISKKSKNEISFIECYKKWTSIYFSGVKEGTKKSYQNAFNKIENNFNTDVKINRIDTQLLQDFFLIDEIIKYSNSVLTPIKKVFNGTFNFAVKNGYISSNPMKNISTPKKLKTLDELEKENQKYLEAEEIKMILNSFSNKEWIYKNVTEFILLTGIRISELQGLKFEDISGNILSIKRNYDRFSSTSKPKFTTPKTINSYRDIILPKRALEIIEDMKEKNIFKTEHIFYSPIGNIFNSDSYRKILKRIAEKNKIKKSISPHILRHTHISLLAEKNVPIKVIMKRVGHADEKITLSIYTHVTKKATLDLESKLNEIVF